jgi:hypothetical protein
MKKGFLFLISIAFIRGTINADIMTELAKRDTGNPIYLAESTANVLYAKAGYLYAEFRSDGMDKPSIVAYQINSDNIKLIIRIKTWDFAYRISDLYTSGKKIDDIIVDVHDYYLVELVYTHDKLETYSNMITDINTNGFIFNEAVIGGNANNLPYEGYLTYGGGLTLEEGMEAKILSFSNERTDQNRANTAAFSVYDYQYNVLIHDRNLSVNGYFLDFSNSIDYRSQLLILQSGNTPQPTPPKEASDYFGTWKYTGTGGMGFEEYERTITITISPDEFHYHFIGHTVELEYTLTDLMWTKITRPDEDFYPYVEFLNDSYKGSSGYIITGTVSVKTGDWPDKSSMAEYVYIKPDDKKRMLWYNYRFTNYILLRQ